MRVTAGLIDGTIWKQRGAGSLMSLRIDEDKMGPGSRGNNLWGFMPLLMGRVPARPASDGRFPHLPASSCTAPLQSEWETGGASCSFKERNGRVRVYWKGNQLQAVRAHHHPFVFMIGALTLMLILRNFL